MVDLLPTGFGVLMLANALWFGYRATTVGTLYRSVSASEKDVSSSLAGGETVAIEGTVSVESPPPLSSDLSTDGDRSIGAYVWRLKEHEDYQYELGEDDQSHMITYDSGVESGTFVVDDGQHAFRVDTDWLAEAHDSSDISTVSSEWWLSTLLSKRSWISPYVNLDEHRTVSPLAELADNFDVDEDGESQDKYIETKVILDGEQLAVRGEVGVEQGDLVLRGSDETPLAISDQGFDAFSSSLRRQFLKYGLASGGFAAIASLSLASGLGIV